MYWNVISLGIGPAKARELVDAGFSSISDLRNNPEGLSKAQKIGLKHFEDFELRIPREEISEIETVLTKEFTKIDPKYQSTICGSYRRGLASSGDVDVLLTHKNYESGDEPKNHLKNVVQVKIQEKIPKIRIFGAWSLTPIP